MIPNFTSNNKPLSRYRQKELDKQFKAFGPREDRYISFCSESAINGYWLFYRIQFSGNARKGYTIHLSLLTNLMEEHIKWLDNRARKIPGESLTQSEPLPVTIISDEYVERRLNEIAFQFGIAGGLPNVLEFIGLRHLIPHN